MSTTASGLDHPTAGHAPASPLTRFFDRWIFVLMALWFITITLTGFIPTSLEKIAAVQAGMRPPFPMMLHAHAVLMGAFLVLLLVQALLVATGRQQRHQKLGLAGRLPALRRADLPALEHRLVAGHGGPAGGSVSRYDAMKDCAL